MIDVPVAPARHRSPSSAFGLAALLSAGEAAVLQATRAAVSELVTRGHPHAAPRAPAHRGPGGHRGVARVRPPHRRDDRDRVRHPRARPASTLLWWQILLLAVLVSGAVALVLVRISPRTLGRRHPVRVLTLLSGLLTLVQRLPIGRLAPDVRRTGDVDEDELRDMVDRVSESEGIEDDEREMFRSVFELGDTLTREVMVPRTEMITVSVASPLRKALSLMLRSGLLPGPGGRRRPSTTCAASSSSRTSSGGCRTPRSPPATRSRTSCARPCSCRSPSRSTTCCARCRPARRTSRWSSTSTAASPGS